jgi:Flp pilus assembly protein TadG
MRIHRDERGQTIMLVALALPIILGFVGLATDVGSLFMDRRQMQTAADAAALAGALNLTNGTWQSAAKAASTANGFTDGSNGVTVNVNNQPTWPASNYFGVKGYIEATVSKPESTIFLSLFGFPKVTVAARAVATNQAPGNGCVFTLGQTGTDLTVQGSLGINAPDCDFNINSDGSAANPIVETGKGGSIQTSSVGVVGPITNPSKNYADFSPAPVGGVVAYSDPLGAMQFPYTCSSGTPSGCTCPASSAICANNPIPTAQMPSSCGPLTIPKSGTLPAGCYDLGGGKSGTTIGSQTTLNLASGGVYFFLDGPLNIQAGGTVNGTDVTLIFTGDSTITMGGSPTLDLVAPDATDTTAAFPGILYYQVPSDTSALTIIGGGNTTLEGVFYAPGANVTLQGSAGGTIYTDFVVQTLTLAGNPSFNSYAKLPGGAPTGMTTIALVE